MGGVGHPRRFTAVSRRLKAQIEAPLVDLPRYHVETSRYTGSAMGPEMGLEVGKRPSGCPATRPRHARTLTGHGRHNFGRFSSWPDGPASRSIKLKNVPQPRLSAVDQNASKVGMRPRVGILSSAPSRRAIASVHRGRTCRYFNGRENARRLSKLGSVNSRTCKGYSISLLSILNYTSL